MLKTRKTYYEDRLLELLEEVSWSGTATIPKSRLYNWFDLFSKEDRSSNGHLMWEAIHDMWRNLLRGNRWKIVPPLLVANNGGNFVFVYGHQGWLKDIRELMKVPVAPPVAPEIADVMS
jgi:hypothetical protein